MSDKQDNSEIINRVALAALKDGIAQMAVLEKLTAALGKTEAERIKLWYESFVKGFKAERGAQITAATLAVLLVEYTKLLEKQPAPPEKPSFTNN